MSRRRKRWSGRACPSIYRVHDEPSLEKIEALREFLPRIDISLPKGAVLKPALFNHILARVRGSEYERLVNDVVLRSQAQAEYAADNYGHFGLSLRRYAHFTSPIRRYADLIVHRGLIRALKLGDDGLPEGTDPVGYPARGLRAPEPASRDSWSRQSLDAALRRNGGRLANMSPQPAIEIVAAAVIVDPPHRGRDDQRAKIGGVTGFVCSD